MPRIVNKLELYKTGSNPDTTLSNNGTIFTSGSNTGLYFKNSTGKIYNLSNTSSYYNIVEFTSSATYIKPSNAKYIKVVVVSGGGGGGSGGLGVVGPSTVTGGTGGGGSGINMALWSSASLTTNTFTVVIGAGGAGGVSVTTPNSNGGNGTNGAPSAFYSGSTVLLRSWVGGGGSNGNTTAVVEVGGQYNAGAASPIRGIQPFYIEGNAGFECSVLSGQVQIGRTNAVAGNIFGTAAGGYGGGGMGGGGVGGHVSASGIYSANLEPKSGSNVRYNGQLLHGNTPGAWGTGQNATTNFSLIPAYVLLQISGSISYTPIVYIGGGGSGGGSSDFTGTTGGGNGSSGSLGSGGGGGGASTTGSVNRSGKGGLGGDGYVAILEYY